MFTFTREDQNLILPVRLIALLPWLPGVLETLVNKQLPQYLCVSYIQCGVHQLSDLVFDVQPLKSSGIVPNTNNIEVILYHNNIILC